MAHTAHCDACGLVFEVESSAADPALTRTTSERWTVSCPQCAHPAEIVADEAAAFREGLLVSIG